jgi:hypothetical protein
MLSYAGPAQPACRQNPSQTRRAMPQLILNFTGIPIPETHWWEQFDDEQKQIVIQALARLMLQAARAGNPKETPDD